MDYIQGKPRSQIVLFESSLEEKIDPDNPVRIIDTFVNNWKCKYLTGFDNHKAIKLVFRKMVSLCNG